VAVGAEETQTFRSGASNRFADRGFKLAVNLVSNG
jgi:hypothetical protein